MILLRDGTTANLQRFIHVCDCAENTLTAADQQYLINQILAHLNGEAYNKCALHKSFKNYAELRQDLLKLFGAVRTVGQVQDEVNQLRQGPLSLIEYGNKTTQLL